MKANRIPFVSLKHVSILLICAPLVSCSTNNVVSESPEDVQLIWPAPPDAPRFVHQATIYDSTDLELKTNEESLQEWLTGSEKVAYGFNRPRAISAQNGKLFILDTTVAAVHAFDLPRRRYFRFGYRFEGKLESPIDLDTGNNGWVYVIDRGRRGVVVFDELGLYQAFFPIGKEAVEPVAIAFNPITNSLFVLDRGGLDSDMHRVLEMDAKTGEIRGFIGQRGAEGGNFNLPLDLAIGSKGELYVLDSGNFRIQMFDYEGNWLSSFGKVGRNLGDFAQPRSLTIDEHGALYVSDAQFGNVQIFRSDGRLLMHIGSLSHIDRPGQYALITGIDFDDHGFLYVLDQHFNKLEVFKRIGSAGE